MLDRVVIVAAVLLVAAGTAAAFEITPSVAVRQEYNDNVFFDPENEVDDFVTTVKPAIELSHRTERLNANLTGEVAPFFYWDNDELDDIDQDYRGRLGSRLTERLSAGLEAGFAVDNRPDRDIVSDGLTFKSQSRRRQRYSAGLDYALTEKAAVGASYTYRRDDFTANKDPDNEDWKSNGVDLRCTYNLETWIPRTVGRLNAGFARYDFETSDTDYYFGSAGFEYRISEIFTLTMDLGGRYTDSDFDVQRLVVVPPGALRVETEKKSDSSVGGIAQAGLIYRGERTRWNVNASHDVDPASGERGLVQRTRLFMDANYLLLEKLRVGAYGGVYYNKSDDDEFSSEKIDEFVYSLRPSLRWEFRRNFTAEAAYNYTYVDDDTEDGDSQRHLVFVEIAYGLPLFDAFEGLFWSTTSRDVSYPSR